MPEEEIKVGNRTDEQIGQLLYGGQPKIEEEGVEVEEPQAAPGEPKAPRSMEEIAAVVYPEKNPLYADVDEDGNVSVVIRRLGTGEILAQGHSYTEGATLAARSSPLPHADLRGIKLAGKTLNHSNFHDSSIAGCNCEGLSAKWSDLRNLDARGTKLSMADFGFSDIRGLLADEATDISKVNFTGAAIDKETYDRLIRCKGAGSARGLAVREMPEKSRV